MLSVSYVGNQNRHQNDYRDINIPSPSQLPALINGTVSYNTVVPYLGFGAIKMSENAMNSHYNSLQVNFHSQISKGPDTCRRSTRYPRRGIRSTRAAAPGT